MIGDFIYVFLNHFVNGIPTWTVRKTFYRLLGMKIGRNSRILMKCIVLHPQGIVVGEHTIVNEFCVLDGRGTLEIGDHVSVSMHSMIYTGSHETNSDSFAYYSKKVVIEKNVWLGAGSITLPGSYLRSGTVIAAGSSFTGESRENGIYSGVPAKYRKQRAISDAYQLNEWKCHFR